ncbi:proline racemase family protein [Amycolatopsis sp., V23-08]|uniref:Proline racemase family protein n=1 Tax=Amycolatopsis heterodermiae TaxID=3110235 RepID=A0ABU5R7T4_9PSEU|nr:proline racemase family protein [Amycolatopsis sp., V23-08]MEA5362287.1 proline racemase family protein [Amycolatopsis sp., V23-08]
MRTGKIVHTVESHTEGMPTRVVVGGVGTLPGATMAERRRYVTEHLGDLRNLLVREPRGHAAMVAAILQPPTVPDADAGVLYLERSGCLPLCGHGSIGVATVLVETGMVEVTEPVTTVRLDTPAGLVAAEVAVTGGVARSVTIDSVPSFVLEAGREVKVAGLGAVRCDIVYGGNFFAIADLADLGIPFERGARQRIIDAGVSIMDEINATGAPVHPEDPGIAGCDHVYLAAPGASRHAMVISPGFLDRSPCGTGTGARMAQLHARGELALGQEFRNESFLGTHFLGRLVAERTIGKYRAVLPRITGRAWLTGTAQFFRDPADPFPAGFEL